MSRDLLYLGITHASAPLAIRESLRPSARQQHEMLDRLAPLAEGRMVLSTCERFELYAMTGRPDLAAWLECVADWFHLPPRMVRSHAAVLIGIPAAEHLLRVAAGLESRILGEPQILGQVRDAYCRALAVRTVDPVLASLGRAAIRAGRRVRHETTINRERVSIATLALNWAEQSAPDGLGHVVIVGTGRLASDLVTELAARRTARVTVVGRNAARAQILARSVDGERAPMSSLESAAAAADTLVTCTSAASYLVDTGTVCRRRGSPLQVADLSVPRNVDPNVAVLPWVRLAHLDDLVQGLAAGGEGIAAAARIVAHELAAFHRWWRERRAVRQITRIVEAARRSSRAGSPVLRRRLHGRIMRLKAEVAA